MSHCARCSEFARAGAHDPYCACACPCHVAEALRTYRRQRRSPWLLYAGALLAGAAAFWTWHLVHAFAGLVAAATLLLAHTAREALPL